MGGHKAHKSVKVLFRGTGVLPVSGVSKFLVPLRHTQSSDSPLRKQGLITLPFPTRSITAPDLRQFGINVSQTGPRPPLTVLFGADPNYQNSYTQQASFGIEREVAPGLSVAAGYAWARGLKITRARDTNLLPAPLNPAR